MRNYEEQLLDYIKNIKVSTFFNEKGEDINTVMKEIILNNCNPLERNKLDL